MSEFVFEDIDPVKSVTKGGWGIVGPYNTLWSSKIYEYPMEAWQAVVDFWGKDVKEDDWKIVEVVATIEVAKSQFTKNNAYRWKP